MIGNSICNCSRFTEPEKPSRNLYICNNGWNGESRQSCCLLYVPLPPKKYWETPHILCIWNINVMGLEICRRHYLNLLREKVVCVWSFNGPEDVRFANLKWICHLAETSKWIRWLTEVRKAPKDALPYLGASHWRLWFLDVYGNREWSAPYSSNTQSFVSMASSCMAFKFNFYIVLLSNPSEYSS
jgi:hypothetical protein